MAYADPQSVTINAIANSLARVGAKSSNMGVFAKDDGNVNLTLAHSLGKRVRRSARLDHRKIAADPFTGFNQSYNMSCYLVVDAGLTGYTIAEQKQVIDGFVAWLSASTGANVTKLLGGEI